MEAALRRRLAMGALCCKPEVGGGPGASSICLTCEIQQIDFDSPVDLWHFYLLRSVGKGAFGKVRLPFIAN